MCHFFAHQPQRDYESQTRSLRIGGHCTSIRLEMAFWDTLEEIAAKENMSLGKFLTTLYNEVLDHHGEVNNFASLLRCSCLIYRSGAWRRCRSSRQPSRRFSMRPNSRCTKCGSPHPQFSMPSCPDHASILHRLRDPSAVIEDRRPASQSCASHGILSPRMRRLE